jgi:PKD repeat protein
MAIRTAHVATVFLLLAAAASAADRAVDQISLMQLYDCWTGGAYDASGGGPPPCARSVLMDVAGSQEIAMPFSNDISWAPDGTRYAVGTPTGLLIVSATGVVQSKVVTYPAHTPAWSPDGSTIAFATETNGPLALYTVKVDGSNLAPISTGVGFAWQPTWAPDSAHLAFTCIVGPAIVPWYTADMSSSDICSIAADGSQFRQLTSEPGSDAEPAWSPDGGRILFTIGGSELALMSPDGTNVTQLASGYSPSWSSDGRIAFTYDVPDFVGSSTPYVAVMAEDGSSLVTLTEGSAPKWRPWDGIPNYRPSASFTMNCSNLTCTFDASASADFDGRIVEYGWQFGDGSTATGMSATHAFAGGRAYTVLLIVMDDHGGLGGADQFVDLNQPPLVSFRVSCTALTCVFDASATTDPDGTIATQIWRFGDGKDMGGAPAVVTHTYSEPGTYTVTFSAWDNAGATASQSEIVAFQNAPPIASFTSACGGILTCTLDASQSHDPDGTIARYVWNFGDGTTGYGSPIVHTYTIAGTYTVRLTVTDGGGASTAVTQSVTVLPSTLHVGDLDSSIRYDQGTWTATVVMSVHDGYHAPRSAATVSGVWDDGTAASCVTDSSGRCTVSRTFKRSTSSVTFTVANIAQTGFAYTPAANHDPDSDSNGTAILVKR